MIGNGMGNILRTGTRWEKELVGRGRIEKEITPFMCPKIYREEMCCSTLFGREKGMIM